MSPPAISRTTRVSTLGVALAVLAAGLTTMVANPAAAAVLQCSVDYSTNDWGSGFTANVKISNKGADAINGWNLTYAYTGNQTLSGTGWNGTWSQSGKNVTVTNPAWAAGTPPPRSRSPAPRRVRTTPPARRSRWPPVPPRRTARRSARWSSTTTPR